MAGRTKGKKDFTVKQREEIKYILAPRLKYRDSNEQLLERLGDKGFEISIPTLVKIKKEMRSDVSKRFQEIAEFELVEEHLMALDMMKLLIRMQLQNLENPTICIDSQVRISAEIRNIQRDLIGYYGSSEIVDSVFKYFENEKKESAKSILI